MSGIGWQDAVAALIVLCAVGYLVRRNVRARKSAAPCGDCPGCATAPVAPAGEALVSIGTAADAHGG
jgi:hypothetical protein